MKKKLKKVLMAAMLLSIISLASCSNTQAQEVQEQTQYKLASVTPETRSTEVTEANQVVENWINSIDFRTYAGIKVKAGYNFTNLKNKLDYFINQEIEIYSIQIMEYDAAGFDLVGDYYVGYIYYDSRNCEFRFCGNSDGTDIYYSYNFDTGTSTGSVEKFIPTTKLSKEELVTCYSLYSSEVNLTGEEPELIALYEEIFNNMLEVEYNGDAIAPDFTNKDYVISIDVNNPKSVEEILAGIHAYDDVDGDISGNVQLVSTTYDPNTLVLGRHDFNVSITDAAGNTTPGTFPLYVYDLEKPVLSGTNSYKLSYDEEITVDEVKSALTATDNFTKDLTITLKSDTYTENKAVVGSYSMVFTTSDAAGNASDDFIVPIDVVDEKNPVITVPAEILVNSNAVFSEAELRKKISVVDAYDGAITDYTITGLEEYLKDTTKVKSHTLTITALDAANNKSVANTTLQILDKNAPELWVYSNFVIVLPKGQTITQEDIISYLSQIGEIDAAKVKSVSYDVDTNKKGNYNVSIQMLDNTEYKATIAVEEYVEPFNFWEANWELYFKNWKDFKHWNYSHWLTIIIAACLIVGSCIVYKKKK